jgi:Fe2+ transport system protein FeoA
MERASHTTGQVTSLTQMRTGQEGTISRITAGERLARRLLALGMRPGKRVRKVSAMFLGGPVTLQVAGGPQIALSAGLAGLVLVEVRQ